MTVTPTQLRTYGGFTLEAAERYEYGSAATWRGIALDLVARIRELEAQLKQSVGMVNGMLREIESGRPGGYFSKQSWWRTRIAELEGELISAREYSGRRISELEKLSAEREQARDRQVERAEVAEARVAELEDSAERLAEVGAVEKHRADWNYKRIVELEERCELLTQDYAAADADRTSLGKRVAELEESLREAIGVLNLRDGVPDRSVPDEWVLAEGCKGVTAALNDCHLRIAELESQVECQAANYAALLNKHDALEAQLQPSEHERACAAYLRKCLATKGVEDEFDMHLNDFLDWFERRFPARPAPAAKSARELAEQIWHDDNTDATRAALDELVRRAEQNGGGNG